MFCEKRRARLRRFVIEILVTIIVVFLLGCVFCIPAFSDDWRDEKMVWDESTQKWITSDNIRTEEEKKEDAKFDRVQWSYMPPEPGLPPLPTWEYYLPKSVKRGNRQATEYEIMVAQRKHYAKVLRTKRSIAESERRRQLMAHRKATGWYDARRNRGAQLSSWALQGHVNRVRAYTSNSY